MQWIWTGADAHSENIYAEFRQSFSFGGGNVLLDISVSDEYAVFVNAVLPIAGNMMITRRSNSMILWI